MSFYVAFPRARRCARPRRESRAAVNAPAPAARCCHDRHRRVRAVEPWHPRAERANRLAPASRCRYPSRFLTRGVARRPGTIEWKVDMPRAGPGAAVTTAAGTCERGAERGIAATAATQQSTCGPGKQLGVNRG